jgi:hypothetical protein
LDVGHQLAVEGLQAPIHRAVKGMDLAQVVHHLVRALQNASVSLRAGMLSVGLFPLKRVAVDVTLRSRSRERRKCGVSLGEGSLEGSARRVALGASSIAFVTCVAQGIPGQ